MIDLYWEYKVAGYNSIGFWCLYDGGLFVACVNPRRLDDGFVFSLTRNSASNGVGHCDLPELDDAKRFLEAQYVLSRGE